LQYSSRGIYLWSYDLRYKPKLYNFNEESIVSVTRKTKDETSFQMISKEKQNDSSQGSDMHLQNNPITIVDPEVINNERILWLSQTEYPDVYNIYTNENVLISQKIGTALIPNMKTSKIIRNSFKNKNAASVIKVKCLYNLTFNKWYPFEIL